MRLGLMESENKNKKSVKVEQNPVEMKKVVII